MQGDLESNKNKSYFQSITVNGTKEETESRNFAIIFCALAFYDFSFFFIVKQNHTKTFAVFVLIIYSKEKES